MIVKYYELPDDDPADIQVNILNTNTTCQVVIILLYRNQNRDQGNILVLWSFPTHCSYKQ